jgi:hypothetical protein
MVKYIYLFSFVVASIAVTAQGDNMPGNGNLFSNVSQLNVSNPAGNQQILQNYQQQASNNDQAISNVSASNLSNAAYNQQQVQAYTPQQLANSNKNNIQDLDNNIGEPIQQQAMPQTLSGNGTSSSGGTGISLPKISFGSGGAARSSSGKNHAFAFSKKMKKLNRRICYTFSRKHHKSFVVDNCFFAWAK